MKSRTMLKLLNVLGLAVALGLTLVLLPAGVGAQGQEPQPGAETTPIWQSSAAVAPGVPPDSAGPPDVPLRAGSQDVEVLQADSQLRVTGSALRPRSSDTGWAANWTGGCIYASSGSTWEVLNTPVYLPHGATVKALRMYYDDTNSEYNSIAFFTVYDLYGGIVTEWWVQSSGYGGQGFQTTGEFTHTVDYNNYSYLLNWRPYDLGSDMQLCGFSVYYEAPRSAAYLPAILKSHP